jgi:NagD protein
MRRFQGYILDLDGTIYLSERAIPGAPETVRKLREAGCRTVFISNKPLEPRERYAQKLTHLGIPTDPADVLTSGHVLGRCLSSEAPGARIFVVGEPPLLAELATFGLQVTNETAHSEEADFVVAAFDRTFDYAKLKTAFQAIRRGARFVATNAPRRGSGHRRH